MILPKSKTKVEIKESLIRADIKEIKRSLLAGAKSLPNGAIDQASLIENVSKQQDILVSVLVNKFGEKDSISLDEIDQLDAQDFEFLYSRCKSKYDEIEKKN